MPRFFVPDLPLHVIQRGNDRQPIFRGCDDRRFFRECLRRVARDHGVAIHAYVLMTNHVHLLATPELATSMPRMMQSVGRIYVQYFNSAHGRTGTLWEGRYKAAIVDSDAYLLACMRYVELNPVRAGLVANPGDFPWSSFRANARGATDALVEPHTLYRQMGNSPQERQATYRDLFNSALSSDECRLIRDATQHAWALGGEAFRKRVAEVSRRAARLPLGRPGRGK